MYLHQWQGEHSWPALPTSLPVICIILASLGYELQHADYKDNCLQTVDTGTKAGKNWKCA